MSNTLSGGRSVDLNVQAGESLKVSTITGTYTATVLAGAGAGTALATDSSAGATYGPYASAVTVRIKSSADGLCDIAVGVSPALDFYPNARFATDINGDIASLVDGAGTTVDVGGGGGLSVASGPLAPTTDVTLADSGIAGNPNGKYWGKATFVTASGETDSVSSIPISLTVASKQINWSAIPVSADPSVVARKLYRTVNNADSPTDPREYFLVATIADNVTTTYVDNVSDGSLGVQIPSVNTAVPYVSRSGVRYGNFVGNSYGIGFGSLALGTGYANMAMGFNSASSLTSGKRNVAIGGFALHAGTTANRTTAIGVHAWNSATTLQDGTAIGYGAGFSQVADTNPNSANSLFGSYSGYLLNNPNGANNCFGYASGMNLTTGYSNCLFGSLVGKSLAGGAGNAIFGSLSATTLAGGNFNSIFGYQAGNLMTGGGSNSYFGFQSFNSCLTGSSNVGIGAYSGKYETGSNSFYVNGMQDYANTATEKSNSLMYGKTAALPANQFLAINAPVKMLTTTVAGLPSAATVGAGYRAMVTDASAPAFGSAVAGGGAVLIPVFSTGAAWNVG